MLNKNCSGTIALEIVKVQKMSDVDLSIYFPEIEKAPKNNTDIWMQGFICAICIMLKCDQTVTPTTREVFIAGCGSNTTFEELKAMRIDESDIEVLKLYWDQLHR